MTSDILARKNADKIRQRTLLPSSQRESATVYQRSLTVQFSCPRATRLSPFVHDLPSQKLPPNGGITQQLSPLRPFPCAHSAVRRGFLTQIPFRLLPDLLHIKRSLRPTQPHGVTGSYLLVCCKWMMLLRFVHTAKCQHTLWVFRKSYTIYDRKVTAIPSFTIHWLTKKVNKKCRKIVKKQELSELRFKLLYIVSIIWKFKRKDTTASC